VFGDISRLESLLRQKLQQPSIPEAELKELGLLMFESCFSNEVSRTMLAAKSVVFIAGENWSDFPFGALAVRKDTGTYFFG